LVFVLQFFYASPYILFPSSVRIVDLPIRAIVRLNQEKWCTSLIEFLRENCTFILIFT